MNNKSFENKQYYFYYFWLDTVLNKKIITAAKTCYVNRKKKIFIDSKMPFNE